VKYLVASVNSHRLQHATLKNWNARSKELQEFISKETGQKANFLAPKTLAGTQDTNNVWNQFDVLCSQYFKVDSQSHRSEIVNRMQENYDALMRTSFGRSYKMQAMMHLNTVKKIYSNGWGVLDVKQEILNLQSNGNSVPANAPTQFKSNRNVLLQVEIYRSYVELIPNIIHFIKADDNVLPFGFRMLHYFAIASAYKNGGNAKIYFHTPVVPTGFWWEKAAPMVEVRIISVPNYLNGKYLLLAAHRSDVLRLKILQELGGIYLDWDVIVHKPFTDLLVHSTVIAAEEYVPGFMEVAGVAVILSRPNSPWIHLWNTKMGEIFDGEKCYNCHSCQLARTLALSDPHLVTVLPFDTFYDPGWTERAANELFNVQQYK
jgi:hypothetical protein